MFNRTAGNHTARRSWAPAAALAAILVSAVAARAETVTIDISWTDRAANADTAVLTVGLTPTSTPGVYAAASISGTYDNLPVTGLENPYYDAYTGNMSYPDNLIYSSPATVLDEYGLAFTFGTDYQAIVFIYGAGYLYDSDNTHLGAGLSSISADFSSSGAPEPATWTMLVVGAAALGSGLRTRRARNTVTIAKA